MKKTIDEYRVIIKELKQQAHDSNELFIEVKTDDLMMKIEPAGKNVRTVSSALDKELLEGDIILESRVGRRDFTVRFYCDNLSQERRTYYEAL